MKTFILALLFLCIICSVFAYPVKEDTFLSIKDYDIALSGVIDDYTARADYIKDIHERTLMIVFIDCLMLSHEILNSLCYLLLAEKPDTSAIQLYCHDRINLMNRYITMLNGSSNIKNQEAFTTAMKTLNNTKRALERVASELELNTH